MTPLVIALADPLCERVVEGVLIALVLLGRIGDYILIRRYRRKTRKRPRTKL
jgi:positive regulator of sigma E activity